MKKGIAPILIVFIVAAVLATGGGTYYYETKIKSAERTKIEKAKLAENANSTTSNASAVVNSQKCDDFPLKYPNYNANDPRNYLEPFFDALNSKNTELAKCFFAEPALYNSSGTAKTIDLTKDFSEYIFYISSWSPVTYRVNVIVTDLNDKSHVTEFSMATRNGKYLIKKIIDLDSVFQPGMPQKPYDVVASNLISIESNQDFKISTDSNLSFTLNRVTKADGGLLVSTLVPCGGKSGTEFIYIKNPDSSVNGFCINYENRESIIVVSIDSRNNDRLSKALANEIKVLYYSASGTPEFSERISMFGKTVVSGLSTEKQVYGFKIPFGINIIEVLYGHFSNQINSAGGFEVDFENKTITKLEG